MGQNDLLSNEFGLQDKMTQCRTVSTHTTGKAFSKCSGPTVWRPLHRWMGGRSPSHEGVGLNLLVALCLWHLLMKKRLIHGEWM